MRIAIFTNNYFPNPYGVPGSIESFRKEFEALGHSVYIFRSRLERVTKMKIPTFFAIRRST